MTPPLPPEETITPTSKEPKSEEEEKSKEAPVHIIGGATSMDSFKNAFRKSKLLRFMYPELKKIPMRPIPISKLSDVRGSKPVEHIEAEQVPSIEKFSSIMSILSSSPLVCTHQLANLQTPARNVAWSMDGEKIAVSGNFMVQTYQFKQSKNMFASIRKVESGSTATFLTWNKDGEYLALDMQRHIGVIRKNPNKKLKLVRGHKLPITTTAWSTLHPHIFSAAGQDSFVYVWSMKSKKPKCIHQFGAHVGFVNCLQWQPNSHHFVSGGSDSRLIFYDTEAGQIIQKVGHHQDVCTCRIFC